MRIRAAGPEDVETVRALFLEYAEGLGFSLCFQGFDQELATLPGKYAPPSGRLLLAEDESGALGCVGLRPHAPGECEMKRLYVRPRARGTGAGRRLVARLLEDAREIGYTKMLLDTLPQRMPTAVALYRSVGFTEVPPYNDHPVEGTVYMGLPL